MPKDLLLEIGTEEIPARFMPDILAQLKEIGGKKLTDMRINFSEIQTVGTPRRMALVVRGVDERQSDRQSENKGPSVKIAFDASENPTKAAQGFARGQGISVDKLVVRDGYVWAVIQEQGRPVIELLPSLLPDIITSLTFPKNMRWGDLDMRFVRPIRWLVALYGAEVIPFHIAEVESSNVTRGHRFLSKGNIEVRSVDDYFAKLAENHVMVDQEVRRKVIREQVERIALNQGGEASIDEDLLEEVVYLVEYPTALCGRFEEDYLALPPEVIITPMREHQRYFPVIGNNGALLPVFITVRNGGSDYIDIVRHGNERVLRARLADARFFFEEDKKTSLADRVDKLKTIVFQDGLGTLYDKTVRIKELASFVARMIGTDDSEHADILRAAWLSKADLVTGMVCEFTELQGAMGREYALLQGENQAVAQAIFEHYLPRFSGDILPQSTVGRVIGIADKMDNIIATFSRGLIPTGSQDPYALRRQALGVVNILIDAQYHLSMKSIAGKAMDLLGISEAGVRGKLIADVDEFFRLRIKNVLSDNDVRYDVIDAVMSAGTDDMYDAYRRAMALAEFGNTPAMQAAVQAFTRAGNLAKNAVPVSVDASLFIAAAEAELYESYRDAQETIGQAITAMNYSGVITAMADLSEPINKFFDSVMVMDKDEKIKNNRLALLAAIIFLTAGFADLSKIVSQ